VDQSEWDMHKHKEQSTINLLNAGSDKEQSCNAPVAACQMAQQ
jgi:hypothetical protein